MIQSAPAVSHKISEQLISQPQQGQVQPKRFCQCPRGAGVLDLVFRGATGE